MKVAIVGSRSFPSRKQVEDWLDRNVSKSDIIVSGGADGPDTWGEEYADSHGMLKIIHPVDTTNLPPYPAGKAVFRERAFARNLLIARDCDKLVAFVDPQSKPAGTQNTISEAQKLGRSVEIYYPAPKAT